MATVALSSTRTQSTEVPTSSADQATSTTPDLWIVGPGKDPGSDRVYGVRLADKTVVEDSSVQVPVSGLAWKATRGENDAEAWRLQGPDGWDVALRASDGTAYQEPRAIGALDPTRVAVLVRSEAGREVIEVAKYGTIRSLVSLQDTDMPLTVSGKRVWFSTFVPGPGIESPPGGPSSLWNVDAEGVTSTSATEPDVISSLVAKEDAKHVAYGMDGGALRAVGDGVSWLGRGKPLLWIDDQRLLFIDRLALQVVNLSTGEASVISSIPFVPSRAFLPDTSS